MQTGSSVLNETFAPQGELTFATVPGVLKKSLKFFAGKPIWICDLAGITHADSAGVALIVEWIKQAKSQHKNLELRNTPTQLNQIAKASNLEDLNRTSEPRPQGSAPHKL